jgi:geranylgeranyl diphosphate synthase type II
MVAAAQPVFAPAEPPAGSLVARYARATRAELARYLAIEGSAPFLGELMADYPGRGGKMMRPAICIANARIFGDGLGEDYVPAIRCAAAIEMLHNALLIHDDVQDGSDERRGRPTLHAMHGVPLAINAGDALMFSAFQPLIDAVRPLGSDVARQVLDVTMAMARHTAEGQALELGWRDRNITDLTEADYLQMALKKTAWMGMIWPAQLVSSSDRAAMSIPIACYGSVISLVWRSRSRTTCAILQPTMAMARNAMAICAKASALSC